MLAEKQRESKESKKNEKEENRRIVIVASYRRLSICDPGFLFFSNHDRDDKDDDDTVQCSGSMISGGLVVNCQGPLDTKRKRETWHR